MDFVGRPRRHIPNLSSRHLLPRSSVTEAPELAVGWIAGTSRTSPAMRWGLPPELLLHLGGELGEGERLGQEGVVLAVLQALLEGVVGIAGDENELEVGLGL